MKVFGAVRSELFAAGVLPGGENDVDSSPGLLSFTIAIVVFFVGAGVNRAVRPLQNWNIPEAVTGGLIAAAATLIAYLVFRVEVNFSLDARDMLLLISSPASASTPSSTT